MDIHSGLILSFLHFWLSQSEEKWPNSEIVWFPVLSTPFTSSAEGSVRQSPTDHHFIIIYNTKDHKIGRNIHIERKNKCHCCRQRAQPHKTHSAFPAELSQQRPTTGLSSGSSGNSSEQCNRKEIQTIFKNALDTWNQISRCSIRPNLIPTWVHKVFSSLI